MLIETCDVCGEAITEINRQTGSPHVEKDKPLLSLAVEPAVQKSDGSGLSRRYVLCSASCLAQFSNFLHLCWDNPKYANVPVDDRLEAFINGDLKPLRVVETEAVGERTDSGEPTTNATDIRTLEFRIPDSNREPEPTTSM